MSFLYAFQDSALKCSAQRLIHVACKLLFPKWESKALCCRQNDFNTNWYVSQTNYKLLGHESKIINSFPNKPCILHVSSRRLLKTLMEKEKLLVRSNSPFPTVFSTCLENFLLFSSIQNCHLQTLSTWKSLTSIVWERLKH